MDEVTKQWLERFIKLLWGNKSIITMPNAKAEI